MVIINSGMITYDIKMIKYCYTGVLYFIIKVFFFSTNNIGAESAAVVVYHFQNFSDAYTGSCTPLGYQCNGSHPVLNDCTKFLTCSQFNVWQYSCAEGTVFDTESEACGYEFHSDCTCPRTEAKQTTTHKPQGDNGTDNSLLIIIVSCVGAIIVISIFILLFVWKRWKKTAKEEDKEHNYYGIQDSSIYSINGGTATVGNGYIDIYAVGGETPPLPDPRKIITEEQVQEQDPVYDNAVVYTVKPVITKS